MRILSSLTREQKEAVGLLQIGTIFEYFDLMLFVHLAILLNELFFPSADHHTSSLFLAFAFASTFVLRLLGIMLLGYIGDNLGRKTAVILATTLMSFTCIIMANLPPYAEIGISATWILTTCRMIQGISSMGEIIGAEIYVTEITKPPERDTLVALIATASPLGGIIALVVASLAVVHEIFSWRSAFWFGAIIAVLGSIMRTHLKEPPEFAAIRGDADHEGRLPPREKVSKTTALAYFLIECAWPLCFYFSFVYLGTVLKNKFGFTSEQIITQNLIVVTVQFLGFVFFAFLGAKINPLKILKARLYIFLPFIILASYLLDSLESPFAILALQCVSISFALSNLPANAIFISHFPLLKRFTSVGFIYALARAIMYLSTALGLVYVTDFFGNVGLLLLFIPVSIGYLYGVRYFEKLETSKMRSDHKPKTIQLVTEFGSVA